MKNTLITTLLIITAKITFKLIGKTPENIIIKTQAKEKTEKQQEISKDLIKTSYDNILKTEHTKQHKILVRISTIIIST